jgi:Arc/MetJ-type ribon-helix-helix transcriptional regulator
MTTIPVNLQNPDLKKIDYLIKCGKFKNRSQAIRSMIRSKLDQEILPFELKIEEEEELKNEVLAELLNNPEVKFTWKTDKNSVELVQDMRNR